MLRGARGALFRKIGLPKSEGRRRVERLRGEDRNHASHFARSAVPSARRSLRELCKQGQNLRFHNNRMQRRGPINQAPSYSERYRSKRDPTPSRGQLAQVSCCQIDTSVATVGLLII